ncbi:MAG: metalloprotease [Desulfurococcales archaeon ex4484_204]|nr:MAG: metalloprotease [Desulfurococcales archaeon ex4484_204]
MLGTYRWGFPSYRRPPQGLRSEALDLIVSWAVLTIAFGAGYLIRGQALGLAVSAVAVATAFVFHELAHREVARRYGLVARYRAWYTGLAIALALALITAKLWGLPIVLAAPGAVVIYAYYGIPPPDVEFRVSIAGPLTNLVIGLGLSIASKFLSPPASYYTDFIGSVNIWLAFFNLLPIPPLDGFKVMRYSVSTWLAVFIIAAVALFVL